MAVPSAVAKSTAKSAVPVRLTVKVAVVVPELPSARVTSLIEMFPTASSLLMVPRP